MNESLGTVIERNRKKKGLSQRELAGLVHVSNSTIARIEKNEFTSPSSEVLREISRVLDVDYNYLLSLNNEIEDEPEIRMIQRAARNMSQSDREKMLGILKLSFEEAFNSAGGDEGKN